MKRTFTAILLPLGVAFVSFGVNKSNLILAGIGGIFLGIYNGIIGDKP